MMMPGVGFVELLLLLLLQLGGVSLPLGAPPGPEDPLLAKAAPAECVFYLSWAGMAEPDPASGNSVDALLSEPEIQALFARLQGAFDDSLAAAAAEDEDSDELALLAKFGPFLAQAVLTRPGAVFVSDFTAEPEGWSAEAALLSNLGEDAAQAREGLAQLAALLTQDAPEGAVETVTIGGAEFTRVRLDREAPPVLFGVRGQYLLVGVGDAAIPGVFARIRGEPPTWLTDVAADLPLERRSTAAYLNAETLREKLLPLCPEPRAGDLLDAAGLGNVASVAAVTGLDETGFVSRTLVRLNGPAKGLLAPAEGAPLQAEDLADIPADAVFAVAGRLDAEAYLGEILELVGLFDPELAADLRREEGNAARELGLDPRRDLLGALGDVWRLYAAPDAGGLMTGWTLTVDVAEPMKLAEANQKLVEKLQAAFEGEPEHRRTQLRVWEYEGQEIFTLNYGEPLPFAPSWCLAGDELIVGLYPQTVKAHLNRHAAEPTDSLADQPGVAAALAEGNVLSVRYLDTRAAFDLVYPLLPGFAQMMSGEMRREGVDLDLTLLPSAGAIRRHLGPSLTTVHRTPAGLLVEGRESVPGGVAGAAAPAVAAVLAPAVVSAQQAAARARAMNNLKQLLLSMHNYHDVYGGFPAAYNVDDEGKPLLSWRVHVLPFLEQQALYDQFHLDEPWDSEHNKALLERMPDVFKAPGSQAPPGHTVYRGAGGKTGLIGPPARRGAGSAVGLSLAAVTDGTSNTIALVEVSDEEAVLWTKPEEFAPDDMDPLAGLVGLRRGGFLAALADGSVHRISAGIDPKMLMALFTRNGGEIVDLYSEGSR